MVYVNPDDTFEFTTDNEYWIQRIIADAEKYPDGIQILLLPSENNGSIKARVQQKYLGIRTEQIHIFENESDTRKN